MKSSILPGFQEEQEEQKQQHSRYNHLLVYLRILSILLLGYCSMMVLRPLVVYLVWRNSSVLEFPVHLNSDLKVDSLLAFQVNWRKIEIEVETMEGHQAS